MEDDSILEPFKAYPPLKDKVIAQAEASFNDLVKKAGTNEEENQLTCGKYYKKKEEEGAADKKAGQFRGWKIFLIILTVICFGLAIYGVFSLTQSGFSGLGLGLLIGGVILAAVFIVIICVKLNPVIKEQSALAGKCHMEAEALQAEAYQQAASLNALFDWNMPAGVISKAVPLLQLDDYFDEDKYVFMKNKYGLEDNTDPKSSICLVQSGSIIGNPFLIQRTFNEKDGLKTYTGSIIITWTTTSTDSQGHSHTVTHTQTLTASVDKFYPYYYYETCLIYTNDAAPDLIFSRVPQVNIKDDEKDFARMTRKEGKQMDKLAEKEIAQGDKGDGDPFVKMGNDEFDALFHAWDRSDQMQFRLLFTPLATKNELELIKSDEPYGDDFCFFKRKCINVIRSRHAQEQDYYANPEKFTGFDVKVMRKFFIDYISSYFTAVYFDLAPLLSIPLYQQNKPKEYIYNEGYPSNVTPYEHETLANAMNVSYLRPENAAVDTILKTDLLSKEKDCDKVKVTGYSFKGTPRTDYVNQMGGDGHIHTIPVNWIEYTPVEKESVMAVKKCPSSRYEMNNKAAQSFFSQFVSRYVKGNQAIYQRKLFACLLGDEGFGTGDDLSSLEQVAPSSVPTSESVREKVEGLVDDIKNKKGTM